MTAVNASSPLAHALARLARGQDLTAAETAAAFGVVMRGEAAAPDIKALLLGLRTKGESAEEVAGAAQALRAAMTTVPLSQGAAAPAVDTCGTGGGQVGTFNISTAAAFVVAAAGGRVAKHGNRSYTSKCGSADLLEALRVNIALDAEHAAAVLEAVGLVFLFAPNYHPAMRHVAPVRKELGVATVMNMVGPLANPAGVRRQVIGVSDPGRAALMAAALCRLGAEHAMVVHAEVGMDEISPSGVTRVWEIRDAVIAEWSLDPRDYGMEWSRLEDLAGGEPIQNAERVERLLDGKPDEAGGRAVALNAGAALYVAGRVQTYREGVRLAAEVLGSGEGRRVLDRLRNLGVPSRYRG